MGEVLLVLVLSMTPLKKVELATFSSQSSCEAFLQAKAREGIEGYQKLHCIQIEKYKTI
jgi:hypothetical protein